MPPTEYNICRICMQSESDFRSVFQKFDDAFIAQIIFECTALQVAKNDGLPEHICQICLEELKQFYKFVQKARNSELRLRKLYQDQVEIIYEKSALEVADVKQEFVTDDGDLEFATTYEEPQFETVFADEQVGDSSEDQADTNAYRDHTDNNKLLEMFEVIEIDKGKLLCCRCLNQFESETQLQDHLRENHSNGHQLNEIREFVCKFCNRSYSSANSLRAHQRKMKSLSVVFECEMCKMRFHIPKKCIQHSKTHRMKCDKKSTQLEKHQPSLEELIERQGRLCCALGCSEVFETETQLNSHAQAVHRTSRVEITLAEDKPVECKICFKRFKDDECLQRHLRFKYQPSKNICTICGAKLPSLSALAIHERCHTKEKPFACEFCSKSFGDKPSLKRHLVKHSSVKPFTCSICGVGFKRICAMRSHMVIHQPGGLPFKCDHCEKRFRTRSKMLYHRRTHTGEKPYPCRYCEKSFADFSNRTRHEMAHTG